MKNLICTLLLASSLCAGCGEPQCGPRTYSSPTLTPTNNCLTVDLPAPLTAREPCFPTVVTVHNGCTDSFVADTNNVGYTRDLLTEIAPGKDAQVEVTDVAATSSKVTTYTLSGTLGAQSLTIRFVGTDT